MQELTKVVVRHTCGHLVLRRVRDQRALNWLEKHACETCKRDEVKER